jgi:hypothetical protein
MEERGWRVTARLPDAWVVDCKHVGNGDKALRYLGRYLYRGVLPEKNILRCENGQVTFRYTDNQRQTRKRTLAGPISSGCCCNTSCPRAFAVRATTGSCTATESR